MFYREDYLDLGQAITLFLETHGLRDEAEMRGMIAQWETLMGKPIANNTQKVWYKDRTLFVQMASPVWRNELSLGKTQLKELINKRLGRVVLSEVKIM